MINKCKNSYKNYKLIHLTSLKELKRLDNILENKNE